MTGASLDKLVMLLHKHRQRATYGAIADALGTIAINVGNLLGTHSQAKSFIVAKKTGMPTGYDERELHPELCSNPHVILSADELNEWLHIHSEPSRRKLNVEKRSPASHRVRSALPYDMGNAGDLLKHGILSEWAMWWPSNCSRPLRYIDPFAGQVAATPPVKAVIERVEGLSGTALSSVQNEIIDRYYGSAHVVRRASALSGGRAEVFVSDRDPERVKRLVQSGLTKLKVPGFVPGDAYTVLDSYSECDLMLIDPFAEFLKEDEIIRVIPRLAIAAKRFSVLLFILDKDADNHYGKRYRQLRDKCLPGIWHARLPKLKGTTVRGEQKYEAEVVLVMSAELRNEAANTLQPVLEEYCRRLGEVLGVAVAVTGDLGCP